jgi:hypothetical protein
MSPFVKLMIGSWSSAIALIGYFALKESGVLLQICRRVVLWLETEHTPGESVFSEREDAA